MLSSSLAVTLISPERMTWSMQRLIKNLRRADETNLDAIIDKVGIDSNWNGPRLDQISAEDRAAAQSIDVFFPRAFRGVQVADKLNAGRWVPAFCSRIALLGWTMAADTISILQYS